MTDTQYTKYRPLRRLLLLPVLLLTAGAAFSLDLYGKAVVTLDDEIITVGDLAVVHGDDAVNTAALTETSLSFRYPSIVQPEEIITNLNVLLDDSYVYVGGPTMIIPRAFSGEDESGFLMKVLEFLESQPLLAGCSIQVIPEGLLPSINEEKNIDFYFAGDSLSEDPVYRILYRNSGDPSYRRAPVSINVEKPFSDHQVEIEKYTDQPAGSAPSGLFPSAITRRNIVSNGDNLTLWMVSGSIQMELQAKALENGKLAEKIRVKITETDKEITAVITGPSEARIEY
ncbi:MAG: hypothetical protein HN368_13005 [Spirochaetales bacterium]|jgi:hypothetical protein|nr:hypothetical protein [Spirochaetales bacterium]